jgi:hypothetical protein
MKNQFTNPTGTSSRQHMLTFMKVTIHLQDSGGNYWKRAKATNEEQPFVDDGLFFLHVFPLLLSCKENINVR